MNIVSRWLLAGFIFLLPLWYSFETQQVFEVNKFTLLCIFSGIFSSIWAIDCWTQRNRNNEESRNFWIFSGLFFALMGIGVFFAQTPIVAFFGGTARHQGMLFLLMMFLLFVFSRNFWKKQEKEKKKYFKNIQKFLIFPLLASATIASALAIQQFFGNFFGVLGLFDFHILEIKDISMRSMGSLGQPNFLAQFLILPFFLSIFLLFQKKFWKKGLGMFFGILFLFAIYASASRAGILGIFAGIIILGLLFLAQKKHSQKIFWIPVFSGFFVVMTGLFVIFSSPEILSFIGERSRSFLARMQFWTEVSPLMFSDIKTFLFGIGGDNLGPLIQPIASIHLNELEGFSYLPDRAHTIWIDFPLHYGVPAFFLFLTLLGNIFYQAVKKITEKTTPEISGNPEENIFIISVFSGLVGTIVTWSFGFYLSSDATVFMIFLGILSVLVFKNPEISEKNRNQNAEILKGVVSVFLIGFSFFLLVVANRTYQSDKARFRIELGEKLIPSNINALKNAPYLEENFLSLLPFIPFSEYKKVIQESEKYRFHSSSFYFLKLQESIISSAKSSEISENFAQTKKSFGNHIEGNIQLFQVAQQFHVLSETELEEYREKIKKMIPNQYWKNPDMTQEKTQKFHKHHPKFFEVILEAK